jgi:hypothetical protein
MRIAPAILIISMSKPPQYVEVRKLLIISELSLEDPEVECFTQDGDDLNLDKFLQAKTFHEPSLEDPLEESFAQFEFDLDLDMIREQAQALLDPTPRMRTKKGEPAETSFPNPCPSTAKPIIIENNKVEEKEEQSEPPPILNLSNDKEVSTKAHSFVTIPLETHNETQVSFLQCLKVLSYAIIFKDLCTKGHKSRNNLPKKIRLSKKIGYLRWRNILPEGYEILKKKGWKKLVGHPYE